NLALATRRLGILHKIKIPEPQLLWALANSVVPGDRFPEPVDLNPKEKRMLVQRVAGIGGLKKKDIADFLHISRQMIARNLKGIDDEKRKETPAETITASRPCFEKRGG